MSHTVLPTDLAETSNNYGDTAFLLYAKDGEARVNHVRVVSIDETGRVDCRGFGRGVAAILDDTNRVSLLWAAVEDDQFTLIADGSGRIENDLLTITVSNAVLHRPAPGDGDTGAPC